MQINSFKDGLNVIHYLTQCNKSNSLMFFIFYGKNKLKYEVITDKYNGGPNPLLWAAYSLAEDFLLYLKNLDK